jgi:3-phenylpropionate/trans-cinnamate dioxygenase ferredoxin reductase subunit
VSEQIGAEPLVIVGAGHAGCQLASSVREEGYSGRLILVSDEEGAPYQRPPLSKSYLMGDLQEDALAIRTDSFFRDNHIELKSDRVTAINTASKCVQLASAEKLSYSQLVLATGSRNRKLDVPGTDLAGVYQLRTLDDARKLRDAITDVREVVVIGAGFIGLEFAAIARQRGSVVRVLEAAPSLMSRAVSPEVAEYVQSKHERSGVEFVFDSQVVALQGQSGRVTTVSTSSGEQFSADLVLIGIGALPNSELATAAGIAVSPDSGGVMVDDRLCTSDSHVWAIGDCADYPNAFAGARVRLESLQNAQDQARCLASTLCGSATSYHSVPWFWTDQGDLKLQIAGFTHNASHRDYVGDPASGRFSVLSFRDDLLTGVESINHRAYHSASRTLLGASHPFTRDHMLAPSFDLLDAAKSERAAQRAAVR